MDDIEKEIEQYEKRTGIKLPAHNRGTLRSMIESENKYWEREAVREDSNNSPVEGYFNPKE